MPYGGLKDSGMGKEGPAYAIEEMTELKMVCSTRRLAGASAPGNPSQTLAGRMIIRPYPFQEDGVTI